MESTMQGKGHNVVTNVKVAMFVVGWLGSGAMAWWQNSALFLAMFLVGGVAFLWCLQSAFRKHLG